MDRLPELVAEYPWLFTSQEFAGLHSELPAGWHGLMDQLCRRISEELAAKERFSILQVKGKLGRLGIRYRGPERFLRLVDETCAASRQHCAVCSAPIPKPALEKVLPVCPWHALQDEPQPVRSRRRPRRFRRPSAGLRYEAAAIKPRARHRSPSTPGGRPRRSRRPAASRPALHAG